MKRCDWCTGSPLYIQYHDQEWGVPVFDDQKLFEMLILEGMQAGLNWFIILKKRENFRQLLDDFSPEVIANYSDAQLEALLLEPGIIRNRRKIFAARQNAQAFLRITDQGRFSDYLWQFVAGKPLLNNWKRLTDVPATSVQSDAMSKSLKKQGFSFVGSTICYAFMQAVGMVNDHLVCCYRHRQLL
jgi:DNA-3-methyladenine glycosylase I